jgi:hypothetical protein
MSVLLTRKSVVLAKIESVYSTDPTPTGALNSMLVGNLTCTPLDAELIERPIIRSFLGNPDKLLANSATKIEFDVELAGAGTPGVAPAWAALLKACAFAETLNTASVGITRSGSTATVTETAHGRASGTYVKISGASQTEYNGTFTIGNITTNTYDITVTGTPASPATGAPVVGVSASYLPVSASFGSVTLYYYNDSVLHKATGAMGSVKFSINVKQIPVMHFSFTSLYSAPADASPTGVDYSSFQAPKVANTTNTTSFSLLSYSGNLESVELDIANDVQFRTLIGSSSVNIIDRKPAGTFIFEAPAIASKDFFTLALNGTTGTMAITHGVTGGNIVTLACPRVSIQNPSYKDSQGVQMISLPFVATPNTGNDDLSVTVK